MTDELRLIWSGEHRAYWCADRRGYTTDLSQAGRYPLVEAQAIAHGCGPEKEILLRPGERRTSGAGDRRRVPVTAPGLAAAERAEMEPRLLHDLIAWLRATPEQESLFSTSLADWLLGCGWRDPAYVARLRAETTTRDHATTTGEVEARFRAAWERDEADDASQADDTTERAVAQHYPKWRRLERRIRCSCGWADIADSFKEALPKWAGHIGAALRAAAPTKESR